MQHNRLNIERNFCEQNLSETKIRTVFYKITAKATLKYGNESLAFKKSKESVWELNNFF